MKTWRARYVLSVRLRVEDTDDMSDPDTSPARRELGMIWQDLANEMIALDETAGLGVSGELSGLVDLTEITGTDEDPFPEEEPE